MLILNFAFIMVFLRLFGKEGLIAWTAICVILANIQVTKNINIFGLESTLGNIVYATGFLATDILCEFYDRKDADRAVKIGLLTIVSMTLLMQLAIMIKPSETDLVNDSLVKVFTLIPRISLGSILAYFVSSRHDIFAYEFWKKRTNGKHLWIRNNASTFVSQLLDTAVFTLVSFYGVYKTDVLVDIALTTLAVKWFAAVCDTPMIYLAGRWHRKGLLK